MDYLARKIRNGMILVRIFKGVWFVSLLAVVAGLLYAYASFPDTIRLGESPGGEVSRNGLFYGVVSLLGLFNVMVFVVNRLMAPGDDYFQAWFYGLVVFFNLFVLVAVQFFSLYNSAEKFNYESIGYIIYGSVSLIILWASLWPIFRLARAFQAKQQVGNS